jgi:hypothetical protein
MGAAENLGRAGGMEKTFTFWTTRGSLKKFLQVVK